MTETQPEPIPWGPLARIGSVSLALFIAFGCLLPIFQPTAEEGTLLLQPVLRPSKRSESPETTMPIASALRTC